MKLESSLGTESVVKNFTMWRNVHEIRFLTLKNLKPVFVTTPTQPQLKLNWVWHENDCAYHHTNPQKLNGGSKNLRQAFIHMNKTQYEQQKN